MRLIESRDEFIETLAEHNPLSRLIMELHAPDKHDSCQGCDFISNWEGAPGDWPCRTVDLIAAECEVSLRVLNRDVAGRDQRDLG